MKNSNNDQPLKWIWFLGSFFLVLGFGVLLAADALHMIRCKSAMKPGRMELREGRILKEKKNRRGALVWELEFTRPDGSVVHAKREGFQHIYGMQKPGNVIPIIDVAGAPECWDVSLSREKPVVYAARQNFAITISGGFGAFFIAIGTALSIWAGRRLFLKK